MPPPSRLSTLNDLPISAFRTKFYPNTETHFAISSGPTNHDRRESYRLHLRASSELSESELTQCFNLVERTSAADYKASVDGWNPLKKRREMRLLDLRYLLLAREGLIEEGHTEEERGLGRPVEGFLSFMLTWEDGVEVIYCYEIHLEERVRGSGVGKRLMGLLEEVGRKAQVEKAMLTVFKSNEKAVRFYERLGYVVDEFSPRPKKLRGGVVRELDYLILSKSLVGVEDHEGERLRKRKAG